jgi:hypothetical protein
MSACGVGGNDPGKVTATYSNFSGGNGTYYAHNSTWFASADEAIAGYFDPLPISNPTTLGILQVPLGTWYFAMRDWLNPSNVTVKSITNNCATPTPTPTPTSTPTVTPTPTATPLPSVYNIESFGYSTFNEACNSLNPTSEVYALPGTTGMMYGYVFYTNSGLNNRFNGNGNWYRMTKDGVTYAVQINTIGEVLDYRDCSLLPTVTPTPTPEPTFTPTPTPTTTFICREYRIENNGETTIGISYYDCSGVYQSDSNLLSGNQITFCANQSYGLIDAGGGSLFTLSPCLEPTPTPTPTEGGGGETPAP